MGRKNQAERHEGDDRVASPSPTKPEKTSRFRRKFKELLGKSPKQSVPAVSADSLSSEEKAQPTIVVTDTKAQSAPSSLEEVQPSPPQKVQPSPPQDDLSSPPQEVQLCQTEETTPSPQKDAPTGPSPDLLPTTSPSPTPAPTAPSLWEEAYSELTAKKPQLVHDYEELLEKEGHMPANESGTDKASKRQNQLNIIIQRGLVRMEERQPKYTIAGRQFNVAEQAASVAQVTLWAKKWIAGAVEASPTASIAWVGVCLFLTLLTNPSTSALARNEGFMNVTSRMRYYVALEPMIQQLGESSSVLEALMDEVKKHVVELYRRILDFQISCVLRFHQRAIKTFIKDIIPVHDWKQAESDIKKLEATICNDLDQVNGLAARQVAEDTRQNLEALDQSAKEALHALRELESTSAQQLSVFKQALELQQATAVKALSDEQMKCLQLFRLTSNGKDVTYEWYKDRVEDRVENTCMWLLEHDHFHQWLSQESGPLLISADPGCGKSVLAKYLVNHELPERQLATVCYYFFKDQDQMTASQALCALIHQLFSQIPHLIKHAMVKHQENGASLINMKTALWDIFVDAVSDPDAGRIVIVLDALDECAKDEFRFLIDKINNLFGRQVANGRAKLKFVMTSRPYAQIVSEFRNLLSRFPHIHIPGEEQLDKIRDEIDLVISHRVDRLGGHLKSETRKYLLEHLRSIENRTYLWIYLVFANLEEHLKKGLKRTPNAIKEVVDGLPDSVNVAYEQILRKSSHKALARKVLSIVIAAHRPFTVAEMNIAVNVNDTVRSFSSIDIDDEGDFRTMLRSCCGLFISIYQDRIYFLHQTAREFLLSDSHKDVTSPPPWQRSFSMSQSNTTLAEVCGYYLYIFGYEPEIPTIEQLIGVDASEIGKKANGILDRYFRETVGLSKAFSGLSKYSVQYWGRHLKEADLAEDAALQTVIMTMYRPDFRGRPVFTIPEPGLSHFNRLHPCIFSGVILSSYYGLYSTTNLFLKEGCNIEGDSKIYNTPLYTAVVCGHTSIVRLLIQHKADIDKPNVNGQTPLYAAVERGFNNIARLLIKKGADINGQNDNGQTPLHVAARKNYEDMAKLLLESGAKIDVQDQLGHIPLHSTTLEMSSVKVATVLSLLVDNGSHIDARDNKGQTPLHLAVENGQSMLIYFLITNGANINARDSHGETPLMKAASLINFPPTSATDSARTNIGSMLVKAFLECGADIEAQDNDGQTSLLKAVSWGHAEVVEALLDGGADIGRPDKHGDTPLSIAAREGSESTVKMLLNKGASTETQNMQGETPLFLAMRGGKQSIVQMLLQNKANPNAKDIAGRTVMFHVFELRRNWTRAPSSMTIFLKFTGAIQETVSMKPEVGRPNLWTFKVDEADEARDDDLKSPSERFTDWEARDLVQILLDHGADPTVQSEHGETALGLARRMRMKDTAELLRAHIAKLT